MGRLTCETPKGPALVMGDNYQDEATARAGLMERYKAAVAKLAAYEDTGLEPETIISAKEMAEITVAMTMLRKYQSIGTVQRFQELVEAVGPAPRIGWTAMVDELPLDKMRWIKAILSERERQDKKWGSPQENTYCEWSSILAEETGELAKELNELNFGRGDTEKMAAEAVQVAAVALAILEQTAVAHRVTMQAAIALGRLTSQEAEDELERREHHGQSETMAQDQEGSKGE